MLLISSLPSFRFLVCGFFFFPLYLPCCLYQWPRITSWRWWQSSAFHVFSYLCSLNHGFSVTVTPALHLSALDEENADAPGFLETKSPFALSECECSFWPMACWFWPAESLYLKSDCLLAAVDIWSGCPKFLRHARIGKDPNCFFSDHIREVQSNSTGWSTLHHVKK